MGIGWRIEAPKSAKTAKRAVTRPAKTARQLVTPTPVKKGASRAWRATKPETGIRQEGLRHGSPSPNRPGNNAQINRNLLVARIGVDIAGRVADQRATPRDQDIVNRAEAAEHRRKGR
jgi:hypothetical protein